MKLKIKVRERKGDNHLVLITDKLNKRLEETKRRNPRGFLDQFDSQLDGHFVDIAQELGGRLEFAGEEYVFLFV
jgi:urate oxidase